MARFGKGIKVFVMHLWRFRICCALLTLLPCIVFADELPSLAKVYAGKFRFGFGGVNDKVVCEALADPNSVITALVTGQSNIINISCFYPNSIHPKAGVWHWERCDRLLAFAEQHPEWQRRAHVLFWPFSGQQNMEWLICDKQDRPVSREEAIRRLRDYIHTVLGRYKGRFQYWDVLNEVVDPKQPDGLRKGLWKEVVGPEVVELAFRFAREADPQAKLFYNDSGEWQPARREIIYKLVKNLKNKGLIDGIGLQQHVSMTEPTLRQLDETIARFSELGLEMHVTELDVEMNRDNRLTELTPALAEAQAWRYRELFDIYLKYAGKITAVMTWNVTDATSWLRKGPKPHHTWPLLFDDAGKPKAAFWILVRPPSVRR